MPQEHLWPSPSCLSSGRHPSCTWCLGSQAVALYLCDTPPIHISAMPLLPPYVIGMFQVASLVYLKNSAFKGIILCFVSIRTLKKNVYGRKNKQSHHHSLTTEYFPSPKATSAFFQWGRKHLPLTLEGSYRFLLSGVNLCFPSTHTKAHTGFIFQRWPGKELCCADHEPAQSSGCSSESCRVADESKQDDSHRASTQETAGKGQDKALFHNIPASPACHRAALALGQEALGFQVPSCSEVAEARAVGLRENPGVSLRCTSQPHAPVTWLTYPGGPELRSGATSTMPLGPCRIVLLP